MRCIVFYYPAKPDRRLGDNVREGGRGKREENEWSNEKDYFFGFVFFLVSDFVYNQSVRLEFVPWERKKERKTKIANSSPPKVNSSVTPLMRNDERL